MPSTSKRNPFAFPMMLFLLLAMHAQAQVTSVCSGSWNDGSTWSSTTPPQAGQSVTVDAYTTVTVSAQNLSQVNSLTVGANATLIIDGGGSILVGSAVPSVLVNAGGTLTLQNGGSLTVGGGAIRIFGTLNMNSASGSISAASASMSVYNGGTLNFANGSISVDVLTMSSGSIMDVTGGSGIDVNGNANLAGTITSTSTFPSGYVLRVYGTMTVTGCIGVGASNFIDNYDYMFPPTLSAGSEVRYMRAGDQTINTSLSYSKLTLDGSGNKSINANLIVQEQLKLQGSARLANYNRNVSCGSGLINNSTASHIFGNGTYTFTGSSIGGSGTTLMDSASLDFSGSSVTIGDGALGNANITVKNVSFTNSSCNLSIGANSYSGTVGITGNLSMSGLTSAMTVLSGTCNLNHVTISGSFSTLTFTGGGGTHTVSGNISCANDVTINTPLSISGNVVVNGDLDINDEFDVGGTVEVSKNLTITGSGSSAVNNFTGIVTVSGTTVSISGGSNAFAGGFTHNSVAVGSACALGGTVTTGSGSVVTITSSNIQFSGSLTFQNLSVTNSAGIFTASTDFTVNNTLALAKDLDMTGYTLTFASSAPLVSTSGTGEVIGTVKRTLQGIGIYRFNGAYVTLLVPTLGAAEEYDIKLVKSAPDLQAVTRYYDIRRISSDLTPAAGQYTLGLHYVDTELNGNNENTLVLAYGAYGSAGENQFTKLATSTVNTGTNIATYAFDGALTFNHRYAFGDLNAVLPVELVAFSARRKDDEVELRWRTATELNNFGFEIQRAENRNGPFTSVGFVEGNGTKYSPTDYSFTDSPRDLSTLYYRLRQIDNDGTESYSDVLHVTAESVDFDLCNYPNPFNPSTTITFRAPADGRASLTIYNTLGQSMDVAFSGDVKKDETVSVPFDAGELPGGMYYYTLCVDGLTKTGKMLLTK